MLKILFWPKKNLQKKTIFKNKQTQFLQFSRNLKEIIIEVIEVLKEIKFQNSNRYRRRKLTLTVWVLNYFLEFYIIHQIFKRSNIKQKKKILTIVTVGMFLTDSSKSVKKRKKMSFLCWLNFFFVTRLC